MSKNVNDVQNVCLQVTLCLLPCFLKFHVLVFDEVYMRGSKIISDHIQVGYVWEKIPKDQPRVLEEGPFTRAKAVKTSPTYGWQSTTNRLFNTP